ncbi:MAG: DUF1186 domain-containing protein [Oscillospiraceae bacterium]|jgi:hypothetical protein|nr:DUF1186 domain-containing protein [Oscillospiraceae bacterium]
MDTKNMNIETALDRLTDAEASFPYEAIEYIRGHKDEAIPELLSILKSALDQISADVDIEKEPFFALYLLAEFRVKEAFPILLDALRLPEEKNDIYLGDILTENFAGILASCATADDLPKIKDVALDQSLFSYAREAALGAINILYAEGVIERAAMVDIYKEALTQKSVDMSDTESESQWTFIDMAISQCGELHIEEVFELIKPFFDKMGPMEFCGPYESWLRRYNSKTKESALESYSSTERNRYIDDTVALTQNWHCFREEESEPLFQYTRSDSFTQRPEPVSTHRFYDGIKIGRNDPCPCGSGKKFKKCHGRD